MIHHGDCLDILKTLPDNSVDSTGVAALRDGFEFIGIEKESEYFEIAKARLDYIQLTQLQLK